MHSLLIVSCYFSLLFLSSCMMNDYSNEARYEDIVSMQDSGTLTVDLNEPLFDVSSRKEGNIVHVFVKPSDVSTFDYVITESELNIRVEKRCTVTKRGNTHFDILTPPGFEKQALWLQFWLSSKKPITLNPGSRHVEPLESALIMRKKIWL